MGTTQVGAPAHAKAVGWGQGGPFNHQTGQRGQTVDTKVEEHCLLVMSRFKRPKPGKPDPGQSTPYRVTAWQ